MPLEELKQMILNSDFHFCMYTHGNQIVKATIEKLEIERYRNKAILRITSHAVNQNQTVSRFGFRANLSTIGDLEIVGNQLKFTAMPFYQDAEKIGRSRIILSQRSI